MKTSIISLYSWKNGRRRWVGWRLWKWYQGGGGKKLFDLPLLWWRI